MIPVHHSLRPLPRWLVTGLLLVGGAGYVPQANAQAEQFDSSNATADDRVTHLNEEGNRLYAEGLHRKALESFLQAYAIDNDPNLLFNIAHCYEQMGDDEAAAEKYEAFLAADNTDPAGRSRAQQRLEIVRERRQASAQVLPPQPPSPVPAASEQPAGPVAVDPTLPQLDTVPWIVLSAGGALTVAGALLYGLGVRDHNQVIDARTGGEPFDVSPLTRSEANALTRDGTLNKRLGGAGLALGAAALATYIGVYALGPSGDAPQLSVAPLAGGARLSFEGSF